MEYNNSVVSKGPNSAAARGTIAYCGVNQAYQIALATHEAGLLDCFYCSVFASPGKWGGILEQLLGKNRLHNRYVGGLPATKVYENPWPLFRQHLRRSLRLAKATDWEQAHI